MGMLFPTPQAPSIPPPPKAPPPAPDVNSVKTGIANSESLSRKPLGQQANLLTGSLGNSNNFGSNAKTLLGS